jgi:hypothetical protein
MPTQIINGFPQFYEMGYKKGKIVGGAASIHAPFQDIDLSTELEGDAITCKESELHLLTVNRGGAILSNGSGYNLIANNIIRIYPNLMVNEFVEVKKLQAVADIGNIPVTYVLPQPLQLKVKELSALCWTNASNRNVQCNDAYVLNGKTIIKTLFTFNVDGVDVFINGNKISKDTGIWSATANNQIELNGDYTQKQTCVEITSQQVV